MRRSPDQLVAWLIGSLKCGIDCYHSWVDDRIAGASSPVPDGRELQLGLITVGRCCGEVGEAAEEIGRTAVHELDQIRKPLIEVAGAQSEDVGPKVGRKRNLRRTDLLGTEIGTSRREECRSQLVEGWRVESSAERSPDP